MEYVYVGQVAFICGAQLWACLLEEATARGVQIVAEYASAVVAAASAIAGAQFASALGLQ